MGELNERRWAVMSERGREAASLPYADAAELMRRLKGEGVSGLCVITDEAALRLPDVRKDDKRRDGDAAKRPRRARKGKSAA